MMSRNRYKDSHSLHWAAVLKWLAIVGTLAFLGMSYVLMKNQILRTANEVRDLETELANWQKRNQQLRGNIEQLASPARLQRRVKDLGLGLVQINELEIVRMDTGRTPGLGYAQRLTQNRMVPISYAKPGQEERP
jgi:hypothetical protein